MWMNFIVDPDVKAGVVLSATQFAEEADAKARAKAVAQVS